MNSINSKQKNCPERYPFPPQFHPHPCPTSLENMEIPGSPQNKGFLCPNTQAPGGPEGIFPDLAGFSGPGRQRRGPAQPWGAGAHWELRVASKNSLGLRKEMRVHLFVQIPGQNQDADLFTDTKMRPNFKPKPKTWVTLPVFI